MKTDELLELGALKALGLLDNRERRTFDRAFRAASPELQVQVRHELSRIAAEHIVASVMSNPADLEAWVEEIAGAGARMYGRRRSSRMWLIAGGNTLSTGWRIASSIRLEIVVDRSVDVLSLVIPRCHRDEIVGDFRDALTKARARGRFAYWFVLVLKLWITIRAAIGIRFADLVPSRKNTQA